MSRAGWIVVGGATAGLITALLLMGRAARAEASGLFSAWRASGERMLRSHVLEQGRAEIKAATGAEVGRAVFELPYAHADARFLGHPVHFVVFDGYTELKSRAAESLRHVRFVNVGESPGAGLVGECIRSGRVEWLTVRPLAPAKPQGRKGLGS